MRHIFLVLLILFASVFTACSYITDFVVVNVSQHSIEVRYKVKRFPGQPLTLTVMPGTVAASQLSTKGNQKWNELSSSQYQIDQESRTVIVRLMPHEALQVASMHKYGGHKDPSDAEYFPVEEITVAGADAELKFTEEQARKTFSEVSRALYTLTYK